MYGSIDHVKALTGVEPSQLGQTDQAGLDALLTSWLTQATSLINGYLQRDLEAEAGSATQLAAAADAGAIVLTLASVAAFAADDYVHVGTGATREYRRLSAVDVAAKTVTTAQALRYSHDVGEPVIRQGAIEAVPAVVHNCADRIVANLVALAVQRRTTPLVRTDEFEVQLSSDAVFTASIKDDLRPWRRRPCFFLAGHSPMED